MFDHLLFKKYYKNKYVVSNVGEKRTWLICMCKSASTKVFK